MENPGRLAEQVVMHGSSYLVLLVTVLLPRLGVGLLVPGHIGRARRQPQCVEHGAYAPDRRAHVQGD